MQLSIISPEQTEKYDIVWLEVNTPVGNFVIQPGHAPTILLLSPKKPIIFRQENGREESMMIPLGGVAEITRRHAMILANK